MTLYTSLHINIFVSVPCFLQRRGLHCIWKAARSSDKPAVQIGVVCCNMFPNRFEINTLTFFPWPKIPRLVTSLVTFEK